MPTSTVGIETALSTLLPTISFLPAELIVLATSLLAQSRAKAARLKPEEEIGRTYACAHIACERLKKRLELETSRPAPPVKPKVYLKLFAYLNGVLDAPTTPRKGRVVKDGPRSTTSAKSEVIRNSTNALSQTPTTGTKRSREQSESGTKKVDVPDLVTPMTRQICKVCGQPAATPHVLVGAGSVAKEIASRAKPKSARDELLSSGRKSSTPHSAATVEAVPGTSTATIPMSKWPALLVALYVCTAAKMQNVELHSPPAMQMQSKAIQAVTAFCTDKRRNNPDGLDRELDSLDSAVAFYLVEAEDCEWLEMEWYRNIPVFSDKEAEQIITNDTSDEDEGPITPRKRPVKTPLRRQEKHGSRRKTNDEDDLGAAGLLPGLGTMFQPAVDWLSDKRRAEYALWKKAIMQQVEMIESGA